MGLVTVHVTYCPMCGQELIRQHIEFMSPLDRELTEYAIVDHLRRSHGRRYGLWMILGRRRSRPFRWLLGVR